VTFQRFNDLLVSNVSEQKLAYVIVIYFMQNLNQSWNYLVWGSLHAPHPYCASRYGIMLLSDRIPSIRLLSGVKTCL